LCALWQVCSEPMPLATSRPRGHRAAAAQGSLCAWERLTRCMQGLSPARARRARRMAPLCAQHPRGARPLRRWRCARARRAPTQAPPHGVRRSAPAQRALPRPPAAHPAARPPVPALRCSRARPCPPQCARPRRRAPDPPAQRAAAHPCPSLGHPCPGAGTCRYCILAKQKHAVSCAGTLHVLSCYSTNLNQTCPWQAVPLSVARGTHRRARRALLIITTSHCVPRGCT